MPSHATTNAAAVDCFHVPRPLWRHFKRHLPKPPSKRGPGRPPANPRAVLNAIWYVLWTACQWKAVHRTRFGVASSTIHAYFQAWQEQGRFQRLFQVALRCPAAAHSLALASHRQPLVRSAAGRRSHGQEPDRAKRGSKVHILVDQRGAPLAVCVSGANLHDKWGAATLVGSIMVKRPGCEQHVCADRGYNYADVHAFVEDAGYTAHIKHRRRRNKPRPAEDGGPDEKSHPARRWVVERTLS